MKLLDTDTAKKAPPSDKRLNNAAFIAGVLSCTVLAVYFFMYSLAASISEFRPFFVFAYIIFPLEFVILAVGITILVKQLLRNAYYKLLVSGILYAASLLAIVLFVLIVGVYQNEILLPFAY